MFDLRSDTVTKPTKEIIKSAIDAELGDDEYGEDPTVNKLEDECAQIFGFEEGLFVTSGLMGNQISLLVHNDPGTEVITPLILTLKTMNMVQLLFFQGFNLEILIITMGW